MIRAIYSPLQSGQSRFRKPLYDRYRQCHRLRNPLLKWTRAEVVEYSISQVICDGNSAREFNPNSAADLERALQEFPGKRFFIQINRGFTGLFHWRVIVGLQDLSVKGTRWEHAQAEGEDMSDAVFDACVGEATMGMRHGEPE